MGIREGGRRLVKTISWIVAIPISISGMIFFNITQSNDLWTVVGLIIGILAGFICSRIGHWVLEGFVDDQENND